MWVVSMEADRINCLVNLFLFAKLVLILLFYHDIEMFSKLKHELACSSLTSLSRNIYHCDFFFYCLTADGTILRVVNIRICFAEPLLRVIIF